MCEFCHKHGEGKKWYLQAKNYSEDFLNDLKRRKFIEEFFLYPERIFNEEAKLDNLEKAPSILKNAIKKRVTENQKKIHFGQVIPIEDISRILDFVTSVVRLECICRKIIIGPNQRYCYGISLGPRGGKMTEIINKIAPEYLKGPDNKDLEVLNREETLSLFKEYEKNGLCHTIWTFHTPFIGGICNCDLKSCQAMKMTVGRKIPVMFKAEYIAKVDNDLCKGCKACTKVCQFDAINIDTKNKKTYIIEENCYGCGICRSVCQKNAITLINRQ